MELYSWVLHRPERIPPHAEVPDERCAECHIRERPDSVWQRISATAGHRIHLESDSASLAEIKCVTCHAAAVHEFAAADSTCGQSACHQSTPIRLAGMRGQTSLHCATCHQRDGLGQQGRYPALAGSGIVNGRIEDHLNRVMNGKANTEMQAWAPQLSDLELAAVITFERNSWSNHTGDVIQPKLVYEAR